MQSSIQTVLKPGDVIGKYKVVRCLGVGGMGEVHLVVHQQLNVYRALKLLRTETRTGRPVFLERFMREARIASRIQHPNIVSVLDVENDTSSGFCYIVMEYVDGGTVAALLRNGPLSPDQAVHIIAEVVKGLAAASELGLVHRDIKPSNIMISQDGQVKLADLGIAKAADDDVSATLTMANSVIGTPAYASPEQCRSAHDVDVRADIYSLGATLYEMVTGLPPFDGTNAFDTIAHVLNEEPVPPRRLNPEISEELEELILKMMSKDPDRRPQTIAELQQRLKPFLDEAADISPELKNLIHERVEREVQARTSTAVTAYRKKQTWERSIGLAVLAVLVIAIIYGLIQINRYHRQVSQLKDSAAHYKENTARESASRQSLQELERLKTAEMAHRTEKKEFEDRIAALQHQLDRERQDHQKSTAEKDRQTPGSKPDIKPQTVADQKTGQPTEQQNLTPKPEPKPLKDSDPKPGRPSEVQMEREKTELAAGTVHNPAEEKSNRKFPEIKTLSNGTKREMIKAQAGTLEMRRKDNKKSGGKTPYWAALTRDFYIGKTEVTQAQWTALMGKNPSKWKGKNLPVENVSWNDAMAFCEKLNRIGKAPAGWKFTLPTEIQWEYAARGGNQSHGYTYSGGNDLNRVGWYWENAGRKTHPVGKKQANELGLYDMSGNVWEWCLDDYKRDIRQAVPEFRRGNDRGGQDRVYRGGNWHAGKSLCHSGSRLSCPPDTRNERQGFRIALVFCKEQTQPKSIRIFPEIITLPNGTRIEMVKVQVGSFGETGPRFGKR